MTFNSLGQVAMLKSGPNQETYYSYNLNGQVEQVRFPGVQAGNPNYDKINYTGYDLNGNLTSMTDGNGAISTYTYDPTHGRLSQFSRPGETVVPTYDILGRVTNLVDATGVHSATYDDLGNSLTSTTDYNGPASSPPARTFTYTYYPDGARQSMTTAGIGSNAAVWGYSYDKSGRYTSMSSPLGTVMSQYFADGRQKKRTLPSGAYSEYTYHQDSGSLGSLINYRETGSVLSNFVNFQYDQVFNLKAWEQTQIPADSGPSGTDYVGVTNYTYDNNLTGTAQKGRLTQEASTRFGAYTEENSFDLAGNPTTFRGNARTFNLNNRWCPKNS
jgi:YD repeat-containing protein